MCLTSLVIFLAAFWKWPFLWKVFRAVPTHVSASSLLLCFVEHSDILLSLHPKQGSPLPGTPILNFRAVLIPAVWPQLLLVLCALPGSVRPLVSPFKALTLLFLVIVLMTPRLPLGLSYASAFLLPDTGIGGLTILHNTLSCNQGIVKRVLEKVLFKRLSNFQRPVLNSTTIIAHVYSVTFPWQVQSTLHVRYCSVLHPWWLGWITLLLDGRNLGLHPHHPLYETQVESFIICWINGWMMWLWADGKTYSPLCSFLLLLTTVQLGMNQRRHEDVQPDIQNFLPIKIHKR